MSPSFILLLLLVPLTWLLLALSAGRRKGRHLKRRPPPGPRGLPIIGHFHLFSARPYRDMQRLAATYGPVMQVWMGSTPSVIVSSPAAASELFKSHDLAILGRPYMQSGEILSYKSSTLGITQYGPYWRAMRKLFTSELLSNQKVDSFASIRGEELRLFVASLHNSAATSVDMTAATSYHIMDIICRIVFGYKLETEEVRHFRWSLREGAKVLAALNLNDFVPIVRWLGLDLQGLKGKMNQNKTVLRELLRKIEKRIDGDGGEGGFLDVLVAYMKEDPQSKEFGFNRNTVKVHVTDIMGTIVETTLTTTEWAFVELLRHPAMMKKLQQEIMDVVGTSRLVEESDLQNFPFLELVLKESMRLHTPLPCLIPHMTTEEITLQGFDIAKGSHILVNVWAMGRDPVVWTEPERFWPERFEGSDVDYKGQDFELIPFGSGRRICAGMHLGMTMVRLILAQLVHCFDWEMPEGMKVEDISMEEYNGISAPRAERLIAVPIYRLSCDV